jgi:excisionase family DNA binding protein
MTHKPAYLRPSEAANYISTSLSSIYRLMTSKQLKSYKINGTRLIKVADLENLVEANAV